ncbi:TonB-dependent siderophore receptor [Massilia sp. G4R7]|uniref:TonB-dependent siderophore receptor n=1 Tax=Massilia phyllostachyos TaxID=2898585 RepID=A0ABS8Q0P1_9BURK|nr:TonB-dependent siderophore receptor [Massilia phyllostachyos]MCD2515154.1 TonB-dependent siderophore receptor [Massilia phyllostachyos]
MTIHARSTFRLNRLVFLVAASLSLTAQAEEADQTTGIQQVQVNARKIGETSYTAGSARSATALDLSLRETPQSVSVVTLQRIEDQNMQTVTDIVNNVIGVSVNQYETNRAGFTARGFDIDNLQIDGIPATWDQAWSAGEVAGSLAQFERVEVVRGATGLMTGAGNPSAAINLVRKHATSRTLTGSVEAGIGRWNERRLLGDVSTPLNAAGTVRARVVGEYTKSDSWVDLLKNESKTFYGVIDADLGPRTLLSAGVSRQDLDPRAGMWGGLPFWYSDGSRTSWDRSKTTAADWVSWASRYDNGFITLEHGFDNGWKLRASANHSKRIGDSYLLYLSGIPNRVTGGGMSDFAGSYYTTTKQDDFGLQASGPFELFGRRHEATFGYTRMSQKFNSNNRAADFGSVDHSVRDFNAWDGAAYPEPSWGPQTFYESAETTQSGLYGVARFAITDPLKLIVGARVTDYEKNGRGLWTAAYAIKHENEVTPYAGLVYDLGNNWSAYASYTDIFQPQNRKDLAGNMLEPIVGKNYELGVKSEFFGGRLNGSFAVFRIEQDKLAQEAGRIDRDGAGPLLEESYYRAAEGAKSEGVEFELSGELAPGWNATAGYSQFRARDASGADVNSIYPRRLLRVFTTYKLADAWSGLTVGGGVNWEGRTWTIDPAAPAGSNGLIEQGSFALVNLMARYEFSPNLSAQFNVDNLFDKKHFGMFAAYGALTWAAPRSASLSLKYRF